MTVKVSRLGPLLVWPLLCWCLLSSGASAQPELRRGVAGEDEIVEVNVVNIDVSVTDRQGRLVEGLEKKDFRLFDNDRKVEITHLYEDDPDRLGLDRRLSLIVLFDSLHLPAASRDAILPDLRRLLSAQMRNEDVSVMVAALEPGPHILCELTLKYSEIDETLDHLGLLPTPNSSTSRLRRNSQESVVRMLDRFYGGSEEAVRGLASMQAVFSQLEAYAEVLARDTLATLAGLDAFVEPLAVVPGRKVILYVGDGLPMKPLDRLLQRVQRKLSGYQSGSDGDDLMRGYPSYTEEDEQWLEQSGLADRSRMKAAGFQQALARFDTQPRFQALAAKANTHRVSFYPLRPPTLDATAATVTDRPADARSHNYHSDLHSSLNFLAESTGGIAMVTGLDVEGFLERLNSRVRANYSLGYTPDAPEEGSVHMVRLKAKRGVRLRYRQSYVFRSAETRMAARAAGALLLGWTDNPHGLAVERAIGPADVTGEHAVTLTVSVPMSELSLLFDGSAYRGQMRLVVSIRLENGRQLLPRHQVVPLKIPAAEWELAKGQLFGVKFEFELPPGSHRFSAGLLEGNEDKASFVRQELLVAEALASPRV